MKASLSSFFSPLFQELDLDEASSQLEGMDLVVLWVSGSNSIPTIQRDVADLKVSPFRAWS